MNIYEYYANLNQMDNDGKKKQMMQKYQNTAVDPSTGEVDEGSLSFSERFFGRATESLTNAFNSTLEWIEDNPVKSGIIAAAIVVGTYYYLNRDTREKYERIADNAYKDIETGFMSNVSRWVQDRQADFNAFTARNFGGVKIFKDPSLNAEADPSQVADEIIKRNNNTRSQQQTSITANSVYNSNSSQSADLQPAIDMSKFD